MTVHPVVRTSFPLVILLLGGALGLGSCKGDQNVGPMGPTPLTTAPLFSLGPTNSAQQPLINEVIVDPVAVADGRGEWFEVHNPGTTPVDLQGWKIGSRSNSDHAIATSLIVPAGGYVTLGRNANQSKNGGVALNYSYGSSIGFSLRDWLVLRDGAGITVDSVSWNSAPAGSTRGVEDPAADNTDMEGSNWTTQTTSYGLGDKGTPGLQNDGYLPPGPAAQPAAVAVSPSSTSVGTGETQQFSASATDTAGSPVLTSYSWSSSDTAVATVSGAGLATATGAGTAIVRATAANGVYGEATLTVEMIPPPSVTTVTVSPPTASVRADATKQFSATAADAGGSLVVATYTWSSSATDVATVDGSGLATAIAAGSSMIRATSGNGAWGEATLTVTAVPAGGGPAELVVRVLDIGQGDATLITNGSSKVVIDGGPSRARFGELLDSLGVNNSTIDAVILSHGHSDHQSGLRELFVTSRNISIRYFFENQDASPNNALQQLRDSVNARVARGELIYRDTDDPCGDGTPVCTMLLDGGAKLHILRPYAQTARTNDRSVPVKLVGPDSASFTMWFAGDAEHEAIDWFETGAQYNLSPGLKANLLKADHHGDCDGFSNRYVELIDPDWVTFSLQEDPSSGRIHTQIKDLLTGRGTSWYRTDQNGSITIRSPGRPGGIYTITGVHGSANATGPYDSASGSSKCNPLP